MTQKTHFLLIFAFLISCDPQEKHPKQDSGSSSTNTPIADTSHISYQSDIQPILAENCIICHNDQLKSGEIQLTDLAGVRQAVRNRSFEKSISHENNLPMPPTYKLDPDEIDLIHRWIAGGLKE